jgi:hypothetical protein
MTAPTPIDREPPLEQESICRRRRFRVRDTRDMVRLLDLMKLERLTGTVTVHCGQGGLNSVVVEEHTAISLDTEKCT